MMQCAECKCHVGATEMLKCVLCKASFHNRCVNMTTAEYMANISEYRTSWRCNACSFNVNNRQKRTDESPITPLANKLKSTNADLNMSCDEGVQPEQVRVIQASATGDSAPSETAFFNRFASLMDIRLKEHLINFKSSVTEDLKNEFNKSFQQYKSEMNTTTNRLQTSLEKLNKRIVSLEDDNKKLRSELSAVHSESRPDAGSVSVLLDAVDQLKVELNGRDQAALANDIEIT